MNRYSKVLLRYGEVGLKGRNRSRFINNLRGNIKRKLAPVLGRPVVTTPFGRMFLELPEEHDFAQVAAALGRVFGLVSFSPVVEVPLDIDAISEAALTELTQNQLPTSFMVKSRRSLKSFPLTSPEINGKVGGYILKHHPELEVDLTNPQREVHVEIRKEGAYVFSRILPAPGGLPVGSGGKGMLLLSGGIDSPVAGWLAMKRGLEVEAAYFDTPPFTSPRARAKVEKLARILSRWGRVTLHVVNFSPVQQQLMANCPPDMTVTIMRRFMFRIAQALAEAREAKALITGENLAQVASQTLESIRTINAVMSIPVLRPLITMDKQEIIDMAEQIETYAVSIEPYPDCCSLFVSKNPKTRPTLAQAEEAETEMDTDRLVAAAMKDIETTVYSNERERRGSNEQVALHCM